MGRRDDLSEDDYVALYPDTYDERQRAQALRFDPPGLQADGMHTESSAGLAPRRYEEVEGRCLRGRPRRRSGEPRAGRCWTAELVKTSRISPCSTAKDRRSRSPVSIPASASCRKPSAVRGIWASATTGSSRPRWSSRLALPHACLIVAVMASVNALQSPTYSVTVTTLVPREQLGRASGLTQLAQAPARLSRAW